MKKVTIVDVAKASGVSISSVSRYLADPKSINQISAVRIAQAIESLNYVPNSMARNLKRGSTRMIGFIQPDISHEMFYQSMKAMNAIFYQNGYMVVTCDSDNNPEKEIKLVNALVEQNVTGIIISPCCYESELLARALSRCRHIVYMDRLLKNIPNISCVVEDNFEKCRQLTSMFLQRPFKKLAVLAGIEASYVTKERLGGILCAIEEQQAGCRLGEIVYGIDDQPPSAERLCRLLEEGYDAFLFMTAKIFISILNACEQTGRRIEKDLYIAGYNYEHAYRIIGIPYPCIIQKPYEMGLSAGSLMLRSISKPSVPPKQVIIPTDLYGS